MKKFSNKGFVLAETIVVAVFMVTIFSALYSNYFPIMGSYERREYYDDIDSKYIAFWLKYMIQDPSFKMSNLDFKGVATPEVDDDYAYFDCNAIDDSTKKKTCQKMIKEAGLTVNPYCRTTEGSDIPCSASTNYYDPNVTDPAPLTYVAIITKYKTKAFKETNLVPYSPLYMGISDDFIDYLNSIPDYTYDSTNGANYRLIIELYDNREPGRPPIYKYSTIEVTKK